MDEKLTTAEKIKRRLSKVDNKEHVSRRIPVSSSMIKEIDTTDDGKLLVVFNTGKVYKYDSVPEELRKNMVNSDSIGKFFTEHIKNKYDHEKLAEIQKRISDRTN